MTGAGYSGSTTADSAGFYVLRGLLPGDYLVTTSSATTGAATAIYYPGTTDVAAAQTVSVVDAATTPSIDFQLPSQSSLGPPISITSISPSFFRQGTTSTATITGTGFVPGAAVTINSFGPPPQPQLSFLEVIDSTHISVSITVPADAPLGGEGGIDVFQLGQFAECFCGIFVADATSTFGTISGHVTRASNGAPVGSIRVSTGPVGTPQSFVSTLSAPDGSYHLGPLAAGDHLVKFSVGFSAPGLASEYYLDAKSDLTGTPVTVVGDADTPGIDAALDPSTTPSITSASPAVLSPGTTTDLTLTGTGFGLDDSFQLNNPSFAQPAPLIVNKQVVSSTEVHLSVQIDPSTPSGPLSVVVFPESGGFGATCNCVAIDTVPESTGTVSGAVTDPSGNGLGAIHVTATADGATATTASGWTGSDGTYALRLPAGVYTLHFEDLAGATADATSSVEVGAYTPGINATITPLASFGALSGSVLGPTNQLLPGALVEVTNVSTGETSATVANLGGGGFYRFATLASGDYSIQFADPGYQTRWYDGAADEAAATPVTVIADTEVVGINGVLPLARRPLSVVGINPGRLAVGESVQATITGSGFAFGDVAGLSFSAGDGIAITPVDVSPDSTATVSIVVDPSAALGPHDLVATRDDGQQVTCSGCLRIFATLGSISGTVVSGNGVTPQLPTVSAIGITTGETFSVGVSAGGSYLLDRLPADDYQVIFNALGFAPQWYADAPSAATATLVTVGAAAVSGIDATLHPARKFLFVNSANPPNVQQGSTTDVTLFGGGFLDGGVTGLTFDGGPGVTIDITSIQSDNSVSATITTAADAELGHHVLTVSRDDGSTSACVICLTVTQQLGTISGRVTGTGGAPLQFAFVQAFAVGSQFATASALLQPDGTYTIANVLPGDYELQFSAFPYDTEWWNDSPTRAGATPVTVGPGEAVTGIDPQLSVAASPLSLVPNFYEGYQGASHTITVFGNGFLNGVTGLAFSAGPGVQITVDTVFNDQVANLTVTTDAGTDLGLRDLVVTRDDGQTATCLQCLNIVPAPPGSIFGTVSDADTGAAIAGTVTLTRVGDATSTTSQFFFGNYFFFGLTAGDYDVSIEATGYESFAGRVSVQAGLSASLATPLSSIRQPLTYFGPSDLVVYQGFSQQLFVSGSGFLAGRVTGLSFDAGPDVAISVDSVQSDSSIQVTVTAASTAAVGTRDITVTRDDGQVAVCSGCLTVSAPVPGSLNGSLLSGDTFGFISGTITATLVGDSAPTFSAPTFGSFFFTDLVPGDYDFLFESPGFVSTTQRITIRPAQTSFTSVFLELSRQPLTITSVTPNTLDTGSFFASFQITGSGFRAGGVTGFAASLSPELIVNSVTVLNDSLAFVNVTVPQDAAVGPYDLIVSRDPGETTTCTGCVTVRKALGTISGNIFDAECCGSIFAVVSATKVGDTIPTATTEAFGFYQLQVPEGDYIIKAEAGGYTTQWWDHASSEAEASTLPVTSGQFQFGINFFLTAVPSPLIVNFVSPSEVTQGQTQGAFVFGSGFQRGGVTGLTFSAGTGVTINTDFVFGDTFVQVTITADQTAVAGLRDVVATRADGQSATCVGCLNILRGPPVVTKVSPNVVKEGKATITVSGDNLQRVVKVTSSSRRVVVQSFKNNSNGTVSVQVKIDGGGRRSYTLTFARDDGSEFTADFSTK